MLHDVWALGFQLAPFRGAIKSKRKGKESMGGPQMKSARGGDKERVDSGDGILEVISKIIISLLSG